MSVVALAVARRISKCKFGRDRVASLGEGGNMVVFEKLGASPISAGVVACLQQSALTAVGAPPQVGRVDRVTVRINSV
ncbi:MAG: hypothetical protein ACI9BK_003346 [Acidimicrobiales bacterium]|jgi:hypothetical protein